MVNQFSIRVVYDVMCWHILNTPCLIKPVFDQLADCPVDLVSFGLRHAEDVEDNIVEGLAVGQGFRRLLTDRTRGIDAELGIN